MILSSESSTFVWFVFLFILWCVPFDASVAVDAGTVVAADVESDQWPHEPTEGEKGT